MKKIIFITMSLCLVGCAGHEVAKRDIASVTSNCSLEKHPSENKYQVLVDGKPYTGKFHREHTAWNRVVRYKQSGTCQ